MMRFAVIKICVLLMMCDLISCTGYFTVTGQSFIRDKSLFHATVSYQGYVKREILEVSIINSNPKQNSTVLMAQNVTLYKNGLKRVEFDFEGLAVGSYSLRARSFTGKEFIRSVRLNMNTEKNTIMVQTDKAIYKPSDLVQFRVLFINDQTLPQDPTNVTVYVTDVDENRVKQFDQIDSYKGVFQGELQLSELAVLGLWTIHVSLNGIEDKVASKRFEVKKYVLPTFDVKLEADKIVTYKEGKISAKVVAKYTFGQLAKGTATVTAKLPGRYVDTKPSSPRRRTRSGSIFVPGLSVSKVVQVDGKKPVVFDLAEDLDLTNENVTSRVTLTATFTEAFTGREVNATSTVSVVKSSYRIIFDNNDYEFKPSLPYTFNAILSNKNLPVTDNRNPVLLNAIFYSYKLKICGKSPNTYKCHEEFRNQRSFKILPKNGIVKIDIVPPANASSIDFIATYKDLPRSQTQIYKAGSSKEFIQVKLKNEISANLSENLVFEVQGTKELHGFFYQILAKGDVIKSKYVEVYHVKKVTFEVKPSLAMLPSATIVVHYVTPDGDIVSAFQEIQFRQLKNFVNITLSKNQTEPGAEVKIAVNAQPNSRVCLLGVDQSVLLLKTGNDIERTSVFDRLRRYNWPNYYNNFYDSDFSSSDQYYVDFEEALSVVITNASPIKEEEYFPLDEKTRVRPEDSSSGNGPTGQNGPRRPSGPTGPSGPSGPRGPAGPGASFPQDQVDIRTEFPETWLFDSLDLKRRSSSAVLTKKVPDTITSWIITGFSLDPKTGLGLTQQPSKLTVFRPFFVAANLPYSIKRGEVIAIQIQVFNYQDSVKDAVVVLYNENKEFEHAEVGAGKTLSSHVETEKSKTVRVNAQSAATVSFLIRPLKVGSITIKVVATTDNAGDGIEKQLIVEPEGVTQFMNTALFIDLTENREFKSSISINVPSTAVPDSAKIEASSIGDILGPTLNNLNNLIRTPRGCGEQTLLSFVPNILVIDYLTSVKKLTPEIESKVKRNMEIGYQGELSYKNDDGSYSSWGKSDDQESGSTWLTAYVAKSFKKASKYVMIDNKVIEQALTFLAGVQTENGSFPEVGQVIATYIQGGASKGLALTAFTLITFLECRDAENKYSETIDKALDYITQNIENLDDTYSLSVTAYALQLANHPKKTQVLDLLNSRSIEKNGLKYWERPVPAKEAKDRFYIRPDSVNVEMTAYALLAFLEDGRDSESISVLRWLVTQRNEQGGFQSTQDTVVGLQALSKIAARIYAPNSQIDITLTPREESPTEIKINEANALVVQKFQLPSAARDFDIHATGQGLCILQISYRYNVDNSEQFPRFNLAPKVNANSTKNVLKLTVCTSFIPDSKATKSNMAVLEAALPSGFTLESSVTTELLANKQVKKVETKSSDTVLVLYFDEISTTEVCVDINAYRVFEVALQKPASVIVYDYYDNTRAARSFYNPPGVNVCDICNGAAECVKNCK